MTIGGVTLVKHTVDNNGPVQAMISCIHRGNVPHYDGIIYLKHLQESHNGSSASTACDEQLKLHQVAVGQMQNRELVNWDSIFHPVPQNSPPGWKNKRVLAIHCHMGGRVQVLSQLCERLVCTCGGKGGLQVVG